MPLSVAYDVTRLFLGPMSRTPRGIDRVDLILARYFFDCASPTVVGVLPTPWGVRAFDRDRVRRGLDRLEELWLEKIDVTDDPAWSAVLRRLRPDLEDTTRSHKADRRIGFSILNRGTRMASLVAAAGFAFGRDVRQAVPQRAVYLNVGHLGLAVPPFLRWLDDRPDVAPVFMLHDVIPLDTPEFVTMAASRHHARMVTSTARWAEGLIVTTEHARLTVTAALQKAGRIGLPTLAQPLPLAEVFDEHEEPSPELSGLSYFVVCGAIEPRKNHTLLIEVWKRLKRKLGAETPHLVVVGSPGWRGREILDSLHRTAATDGRIHCFAGLSSPSLKRLIAGACGVLVPSHAEGFGLPVVEAEHLGIPVIASDIDAHREVISSNGVLVDPLDGLGWITAICNLLSAGSHHQRGHPRSPLVTRQAYAEAVNSFIGTCADAERLRPRPPIR